MPIILDMPQYSAEWETARLGIPTASQFKNIITPEGKPSKSWKKYAYHLIAEKLLGRPVDTYTSPWMERGSDLEEDAMAAYEFESDNTTKPIGFILRDDKSAGCSPDRLIGDDGLLEIKCPKPAVQVQYLLTGEVDKEYWPQLQGQLFVSERKWVDILAFHPELPRAVIRVERDESFIGCLESQLWEFNSFLHDVMQKIESLQPKKGEINVLKTVQF